MAAIANQWHEVDEQTKEKIVLKLFSNSKMFVVSVDFKELPYVLTYNAELTIHTPSGALIHCHNTLHHPITVYDAICTMVNYCNENDTYPSIEDNIHLETFKKIGNEDVIAVFGGSNNIRVFIF